MDNINYGELIKNRREEIGLKQRGLCEDGKICSERHLQFIEAGERMPSRDLLKVLLERLGEDPSLYILNVNNKETAYAHNKLLELDALMKSRDYVSAQKKIARIQPKVRTNFEIQMLSRIKAELLFWTEKDYSASLSLCIVALDLTRKNFDENQIGEYMLSEEEVNIINMMAKIHAESGDVNRCIKILYGVRQAFQKPYITDKLKSKVLISALYNLSKALGSLGRYEEELEIASEGINISTQNYNLYSLGSLYYNKAHAFYHLGDVDAATENFKLSYHAYIIQSQHDLAEMAKKYAAEKYGILV